MFPILTTKQQGSIGLFGLFQTVAAQRPGTIPEPDCIPGSKGFTCNDGNCVANEYKCDGFADCADGSDETTCQLRSGRPDQFRCRNLRYVPNVNRCDGVDDCGDGTDEQFCDGIGKLLPVPPVTCAADQFNCMDGQCIPNYQRCNMAKYCRNATDEKNCPCNGPEKFQCKNGRCINSWFKCDRMNDCGDRSDETGCTTYDCKVHEHKCRDGSCVLTYKSCKDGPGTR